MMFLNTLFEKKGTYLWVYFFGGGSHLMWQRKFYAAFFYKLWKSHKVAL